MDPSVALAGLSGVLAVLGLGLLAPARTGARRRGGGAGGARAGVAGAAMRVLAAAGARAQAANTRRRGGAQAPRSLEARIAAAGRPLGLGPRELMSAKLAATVAGGAFGALLGAAAPGRLGIALTAAGPIAGFFAPELWLSRRARERARSARRELADLLDLLRVTVESGHSLGSALAAVGRRADGVLAAEWRAVGAQLGLGVTLERALERMVERLPLPEVEALAGAVERARRHGAPLAATLAAQARDARLARRRRVQEEAARAGPKIQLVVALLLVPSVLLLVAAALAAALLGGGGGAGELVGA